ncbi:putative beta-D-xylosidase 2 [Acorus calamus]|uniref:Beta-D-xylosidase 2 n=1 Tax=Acorus calamus TaxID=4465 RepID=A0AAV9F3N4_ACOCL|nr:putative beta-D-xylosidase 2 [Acorus calamus]
MPKLPLLLLFLLLCFHFRPGESGRPAFACGGGPASSLPFCRTSLPIRDRVRDLIGRLTLQEKVRLLVNNAAAVPRLGIGGYEWWSEALHGVSNVGPGTHFGGAFAGATSFPQVLSSAASFNASLWEEIGKVVSGEARAMYNGGQAGLTYWSPNVNVFRDPRWGRGQETPGEDPVVAAKYAAAYVRGLQGGGGGGRLKVAACCKHYTAYDLDNWKGVDRFHFNALVSKQDLEETYDVPFKACVVEGRVASVMCSYNQVNGVPTCADQHFLRNTVRRQWGLDGYIVSDCDSVSVFYNDQHFTSTPEAAAADAIRAGLDLDCGPFLAVHTISAVQDGKLGEKEINGALSNTLKVQMRLGMYDGDPSTQPFGHLGPSDVCTPQHRELALEAARQGIVLLKNSPGPGRAGPALPLSPTLHRTVAVIGPNSAATATMIGNYAGVPCGYVTAEQGIGQYAHVIHQTGCTNVECDGRQPFGSAVDSARRADAVVLVMGLDQSVEAEFRDRTNVILPGRQGELITKVARVARGPVILVLMCGGPVDVGFAERDSRISAIVWAGYPGESGGTAIADVLFGRVNPSGKLPNTWYPQEYVQTVSMTDMNMRSDPSRNYPGRTYRFYHGPVVYPFGHGLSYTQFAHSLAHAPTEMAVPLDGRTGFNDTMVPVKASHARCDGALFDVHVDVSNVGTVDGSHTVFVFATQLGELTQSKRLVGFEKVHVPAQGTAHVRVGVDVCRDLSLVDKDGVRRIPIGEHMLQIGELSHSISIRLA